MINSFKSIIETMFNGNINNMRAIRLEALERMHGFSKAEAVIVDDVFLHGTKAALLAFGEQIDSLTDDNGIRIRALPYILRGFVANTNNFEDLIVSEMISAAVEQGAEVQVVGGDGSLDCPCPTCTAARMAGCTSNEALSHER